MNARENYEWLMARGKDNVPRIERLGWKRLARIYRVCRHSGECEKIRKAIEAEARRCGYKPETIFSLHA